MTIVCIYKHIDTRGMSLGKKKLCTLSRTAAYCNIDYIREGWKEELVGDILLLVWSQKLCLELFGFTRLYLSISFIF